MVIGNWPMLKSIPKLMLASLRRELSRLPCGQTGLSSVLCVQKKNLKLISCSNIVFHAQSENLDGYLSECRRHQSIQEYVQKFIDDYFTLLCADDDISLSDQALIRGSIENPEDFDKFVLIGKQSPYHDTPYCRYLQTDDGEQIGLHLSNADEAQKARIRHFTERYAWPQLTAYYLNSDVRQGTYHCRTAAKVLATEAMARLIGLGDMVPHAQYMKLVVSDAGNRVIFGSFMDKALGVCAMDIPGQHRRSMITPEFQRAMLNMNLLDVICHEQDHSPNNYNVVIDERGLAKGVSVYDNNGVGTFSLSNSIDYETYKKCSSFVRTDGTVNRPCMEKSVAEAIFSLNFRNVNRALSPYLSKAIIWCTWKRIIKLKRAIKKSVRKDPDFLIAKEVFSDKTIEDELNGNYGKTYLLSFLSDCQERSQYK